MSGYKMNQIKQAALRTVVVAAAGLGLASCVNLGGAEPPASLLTLTATTASAVGANTSVSADTAIRITEPDAPAKLSLTRVPVQVDATEIAYLQDAIWVEKPTRLFRRLLAETIRASSKAYVIDGDEQGIIAKTQLSGTLREFGYDARTGSVIVQFDAVMTGADGKSYTRRFESIQAGVPATAGPVGSALNRGANDVAAQINGWMFGTAP